MTKKKLITSIIILVVLCVMLTIICNLTSITTVANENKNYTKEELVTLIEQNRSIKEHSHTMANSARILGWTEDSELIKELQTKWKKADENQKHFQVLLDKILSNEAEEARKSEEERKAEEAKWTAKSAEYPVATQIWRYMKAQGWNDYVCAGILGNIMAEVGGGTLDIRYALSSYDGNYYGMCQWSRGYSKVWGAGLETQCDFLRDTIKYEFDTYGGNYQYGFNFNSFLNITDAQQAALAFAKAYERCASWTYGARQNNAVVAYNYFVD